MDALSSFHPAIRTWFERRFPAGPTPPQQAGWRRERKGEIVKLSAVDPLNLVGILTDGPRIPAVRTNQVIYRDGLPVGEEEVQQDVDTR